MKIIRLLIFILICSFSEQTSKHSTDSFDKIVVDTHEIILRSYGEPMEGGDSLQLPGDISTTTVEKLTEPLKGLAAFYSALGGSYCAYDSCELTTALGLGKQGSDAHKEIIKKYLPNDSIADFLIKQDCYLRPDGASSFSSYEYLTIIVSGDTVKADYILWNYNRGSSKFHKELDIYLFKQGAFRKIKRNDTWAFPQKTKR